MKEGSANMKFSVIDTERKYAFDYTESVYSDKQIVSYGKDNNFPNLLFNCYTESATLKSVIDGMCAYVLGDEVIVSEDAAKFKERVNGRGDTMRMLLAQIVSDYFIYGGFAIQVIYSKLGTITDLYPLNFSKCRTNESGTKIYYNKKGWSRYASKGDCYDAFDRSKFSIDKPTQIFYFKGEFTKNVYPMPMWRGALNDVLTEIECSKYSLNTVSNGFAARYLLQLPNSGNYTEKQQEEVENAIKEKFCGADTDCNFMLNFANGTDMIQVDKIESDDTSDKYIAIKENARGNVYTAMRCTPLLMGLTTLANTGFSTNEFKDSFKLFQKTTIAPIQKTIIGCLNRILGCDAIDIKAFEIKFEEQ